MASNVTYSNGNTLLHQFVLDNSYPNTSGSINYITAVLSAMSDTSVNAINDKGYSALHLAVSKNNILMLKKLLSCLGGIDVNVRGNIRGSFVGLYEDTALHLAASLGHLSIVQELLDSGADVNARGNKTKTPLHDACEASGDNSSVVKFLLQRGADVNAETVTCSTPLHYACNSSGGNSNVVKLLLEGGADVNAKNIDRETPLHYACQVNGDVLNILKSILESGDYLCAKYESGYYEPFDYMSKLSCNISYSVQLLLESGADVNAKNIFCRTPLHYAYDVMGNNSDCAELLLERGADVNAKTKDCETPLHYARRVIGDNSNIITLLLERGGTINA